VVVALLRDGWGKRAVTVQMRNGGAGVWGLQFEARTRHVGRGRGVRVVVIRAERATWAWPRRSERLRGRDGADERGLLVREKREHVQERARG
jgi:hypothetical protein